MILIAKVTIKAMKCLIATNFADIHPDLPAGDCRRLCFSSLISYGWDVVDIKTVFRTMTC